MSAEYAAEAVADLERMILDSLGAWQLPPETAVSVMNLSENATFLLQPPNAAGLVLRVHRVGYCSPDEIRSELAWMAALRADGAVATARPIPGHDGALVQRLEALPGRPARHAVAFERLPGAEPRIAADAAPWFERLGRITASMHRHARAWVRPAGFVRKRWDLDAMVGAGSYWGPWRAAIGLDTAGARTLEAALASIRRRLDAFGTDLERFGLVHADMRLANLLVDGEDLRIIDFDDCGFSWFLYDFAAAVSFIEHEPQIPQLLDAWVRGYRQVGSLDADDLDQIPSLVMLRRILLCAWLASHAEVPIARELGAAYTEGTVALADELLHGRFLSQPR